MTIEQFRKNWGIVIAVLLGALVYMMPAQEGLSPEGHKALALFAGVFILYLTESIPLVATGLLIAPAAVLMGIMKIGPALTSFASSSVFLMLGSFVLAAAMIKTNLAERITYQILDKIGSTTLRITVGIVLANIVLSFLIPSSTARTAILLPICMSVIQVFHTEGRTKFAVNLLITMAFTNATISAGILTATVPNPVTIEYIVNAGGNPISYIDWLKIGFLPALIMTIITWAYIQWIYKPEFKEIPGGAAYVKEKIQQMGSMSRDEKFTFAIFILVAVLWCTGSITKIDSTTACLFAAVLLFLPKVGVLTWKETNPHIGWNVLLLTGGGMSMGAILMKTGASKWMASTIFSLFGLQSLSIVMLLFVVMVIAQFMHFFFAGTTVMATAMLPIIMALSTEAGLAPAVLAIPAGMIIGGYPLLMFYCTSPNIMIYGNGELLNVGDFPKIGVPVSIIACIVYLITASTYWPWLGLF